MPNLVEIDSSVLEMILEFICQYIFAFSLSSPLEIDCGPSFEKLEFLSQKMLCVKFG